MPDACRVSGSEAGSTRSARSAWRCRARRALPTRPLGHRTTEDGVRPTARSDGVDRSEMRLRARAPPALRTAAVHPVQA